MVFNQTQNFQLKNKIIDELKLNPVVDNIPSVVNPTIQPVFEVNPKFCNVIEGASKSTTGSSTLFTTPSDKDFYLVAATVQMIKDATCDHPTGDSALINVIVNGNTEKLCVIGGITLTAQAQTVSISLPIPLKIDRNTSITIAGGSYTAGTMVKSGSIVGYTLDTAIKTV